jgi:hypothetical protein
VIIGLFDLIFYKGSIEVMFDILHDLIESNFKLVFSIETFYDVPNILAKLFLEKLNNRDQNI